MTTKSDVTFVTVYMNIYSKKEEGHRDMAWRFQQFAKIAETGIQICVYIDESSEELLDQFIELYPNLRKMRVWKSIQDTWVHKECSEYALKFPQKRNLQKDTYEYMALMHTKMECMADAVQENPFGSTHFAWIDFNIAHIFQSIQISQSQLKRISINRWSEGRMPSHSDPWSPNTTNSFAASQKRGNEVVRNGERVWSRSFLVIPGCWSELPTDLNTSTVLNSIHWRFCGGFFMGDRDSVMDFCTLYQTHFPRFLKEFSYMTWEVNFWAYMEHKITGWKPQWYAADHNDSILHIPWEYWSLCLAKNVGSYQCIPLEMPFLETNFFPMSASVTPCREGDANLYDRRSEGFGRDVGNVVETSGYWMNTRYVNYRLADNGSYLFFHPDKKIITKNLCTRLDKDMNMVEHFFMSNPTDLISRVCAFEGVEDIRIWWQGDQLYYTGSSVNYAPKDRTRIVMGEYDTENRQLRNNIVLIPPTDTWCEKNWCPICDLSCQTFLYQCADMTMCHVESEKLVIYSQTSGNIPYWFSSCRGSTYFRESLVYPGYWIGLVHFSVNEYPRNYHHVLVLLEPHTGKLVKHSPPFSFCKSSTIEFCIGFIETGDKYHFWVSQFDRDPVRISVDVGDMLFMS